MIYIKDVYSNKKILTKAFLQSVKNYLPMNVYIHLCCVKTTL